MSLFRLWFRLWFRLCFVLPSVAAFGAGCAMAPRVGDEEISNPVHPVHEKMPRELSKVTIPPYVIAPPDVLLIDAVQVTPRPPYRFKTGDVIGVTVENTLQDEPIDGAYPLEPGGIIDLKHSYGRYRVAGKTLDEAKRGITEFLKNSLEDPEVTVTLVQIGTVQQIQGEHLVASDGMVTLGVYGRVHVAGMTIPQARMAIEAHLTQFLEEPEISVDVFSFNSKFYYVITEGAGLGDGVLRFPFTGNETVLDAIANVNGLTQLSSKRIWIARPSHHADEVQIMPVDWRGVTKLGSTSTNYQLFPGDRVFISQDRFVTFDNHLAKILAPVERLFGFTLLGVGTVRNLSGNVLSANRQIGGTTGIGGF